MWNNTNPAELFSGTTWELITAGKYIQSGSTALQQGGSNSVSILKENLPNIKLSTEPHTHTQPVHKHSTNMYGPRGAMGSANNFMNNDPKYGKQQYTNEAGGDNTGSSSPKTETLGNGIPLNVQPAYITLKFWKRLT